MIALRSFFNAYLRLRHRVFRIRLERSTIALSRAEREFPRRVLEASRLPLRVLVLEDLGVDPLRLHEN